MISEYNKEGQIVFFKLNNFGLIWKTVYLVIVAFYTQVTTKI